MADGGDISLSRQNEEDNSMERISGRNNNNNNNNSDETNGKIEISLATASSMFPGFRFSPTDEELISYYLKKKVEALDERVEVIPEVEIWRHEPWDLPGKSVVQSDNEWFFFSPCGRKYPNGSQSRRATESGYWKATGKERNVKSGSKVIGTKRTLVFHVGRAPKGQRTQWIMHEYCIGEKEYQDSMVVCRLRKNNEFHLNDTLGNSRNKSIVNTSNNAFSELEYTGGLGGLNAGDSCSKECSSSLNSHSVEQIDPGFDCDLVNEISQCGSSSHHKDDGNAEDWFADIMRDDIIKLDDTSLNASLDVLSVSNKKPGLDIKPKQPSQGLMPHVLPFQGTANRRLRLRRDRVAFFETSWNEAYEIKNANIHPQKISRSDKKQFSRRFISLRLKSLSIYIVLVSLVLLFLFLSSLEGSYPVKWFRGFLL
ncbi:PREDICTED: NAC domain-containing protein 60-like [Ipomoea nil]|uniref:NAC domain-containing protein 60-like n=1 Tax=Ipomoea nil TaxID=35883 RepID=UPI0009016C2C|nr:PREDICTED: NAC domain-containing protein 60-like [Ipomoea nil]